MQSIKSKLLIFVLCTSLIPIAIMTAAYYMNARNVLKRQTLNGLTAVAESKKAHVLNFLEAKKGRAIDFSSDGFIRDSLEEINSGIINLRQDTITALNIHLSKNKMPLDPHIVAIEVVDTNGETVASTNETMIGRDVSGLEIYKRARHADYNSSYVSQPYHSAYLDAKNIEISAPITSRRSSNTIGVLINHYSASFLNEITTQRTGLMETGEVYIVNKDKLMITESRFIENAPLEVVVDTEPVRRISGSGETMTGIYPDYRGVSIVGASAYIPEYDWILLAEIEKAEAFAPLKTLDIFVLILSCVCTTIVIAVGVVFAFSVTNPIITIKNAADKLRGGRLKERIALQRSDEIGQLAQSFNSMADELSKETHKLMCAVEQSACTVVITDIKGNIEYVNPKFTQLTGYKSEEVIGKNPRILKSGRMKREEYRRLWETITSGREWSGEFHNRKKSGELYWERAVISPVKYAEGGISHFIAIKEDITERIRLLEELQDSEERFRDMVNKNRDAFIVVGDDNRIIFVNPAAQSIFGYRENELLGRDFGFPIPAAKSIEIGIVREDGEKGTGEMRVVGTKWESKTAYIITISDITGRKKAEETIQHMAYHDPLTGLANRLLFGDRMKIALAHASRRDEMLAVLILDLDRFKIINDSMGHDAGDMLLKTLAEKLSNSVRKGDTIARLGGDEFAILLTGFSDEDNAMKTAEKILEIVGQPSDLSVRIVFPTVSIGIAIFPNDGDSIESLMRCADTAMYRAKDGGRNRYCMFTQELHKKMLESLKLESDIRNAVENEDFVLFYQPKVCLRTGRISGAEALLRWKHSEHGPILPKGFITVAEEIGMIIPISMWAIRSACAQIKAWQEAALPPIKVAVNFSSHIFQLENLVEQILEIGNETGIDLRSLDLEITEGTLIYDVENISRRMARLNSLGIDIYIDDFGTGYSSLSYLKKFNIHALKIDQSFVTNVTTDSNDAAIVRAIILMSKELNLRVIAEGVETGEQLAFLKELQCDEAQGYLFGRPMPAGKFEKLLRRNK